MILFSEVEGLIYKDAEVSMTINTAKWILDS
jgi:hypothetical protein